MPEKIAASWRKLLREIDYWVRGRDRSYENVASAETQVNGEFSGFVRAHERVVEINRMLVAQNIALERTVVIREKTIKRLELKIRRLEAKVISQG